MLADLLLAGTATTNGTLNYAILFLLFKMEIQEKCQQEIDSIVPKHLTPSLDDIEKHTQRKEKQFYLLIY